MGGSRAIEEEKYVNNEKNDMGWYSLLDGRVCNALIIFIAPPSPSLFSISVDVTIDVAIPCSSTRASAKDDSMVTTGAVGGGSKKGEAVGAAAAESSPATATDFRDPPDGNKQNIVKFVV